MRIEITAVDDSGLQRERFFFDASIPLGWGSVVVKFASYHKEHRQSKRHRTWVPDACWDHRPHQMHDWSKRLRDKPHLPTAVADKLKAILSQRIEYRL